MNARHPSLKRILIAITVLALAACGRGGVTDSGVDGSGGSNGLSYGSGAPLSGSINSTNVDAAQLASAENQLAALGAGNPMLFQALRGLLNANATNAELSAALGTAYGQLNALIARGVDMSDAQQAATIQELYKQLQLKNAELAKQTKRANILSAVKGIVGTILGGIIKIISLLKR